MSELKEFLGKSYQLDSSENYDEFLLQLGTSKHTAILALNSKPIIVLSRQKDRYILTTTYPEGRSVKIKFKPEEEIQRRRAAGRPTSSMFHVIKNTLIEELLFDDKKILIEREFLKKDLVVTMEVDDVKCFRFYKFGDPSKLSIATETSRRFSLGGIQDKEDETELQEVFNDKFQKIKSTLESEEENFCF